MKFFPVFSLLKDLFSLFSKENSEYLLLSIDASIILEKFINTLVSKTFVNLL